MDINQTNTIKLKEIKLNDLRKRMSYNKDIMGMVDLIISKEKEINKGKITNKWKNNRYVELKKMKLDELYELKLNCEISKLTPDAVKNEINNFRDKVELQYRITDNIKVKTVEYMFDVNELKFWDKNDIDNYYEIDLNEFIDWSEVNEKAINQMKQQFPKETEFIDIDENGNGE